MLYVRLKMLKRIIKKLRGNFLSYTSWTKSWENDTNYIKCLQEDVKDPKNPWIVVINDIEPYSRVLSAGCGAGREVKELVRKKCDVTAIDLSEKMITLSKKNNPSIKHVLADMIIYKEVKKFDYITCLWNTINFIPNCKLRKKFIENCYENLNKNGRLIITTSHKFSNLSTFLNSIIMFTKDYYYSPKQINEWFKDTNFNLEKKEIDNETIIIAKK
jgi:SAM-dependent methyltransferase